MSRSDSPAGDSRVEAAAKALVGMPLDAGSDVINDEERGVARRVLAAADAVGEDRPDRCEARNHISRCQLPAGHDGYHYVQQGAGSTSWASGGDAVQEPPLYGPEALANVRAIRNRRGAVEAQDRTQAARALASGDADRANRLLGGVVEGDEDRLIYTEEMPDRDDPMLAGLRWKAERDRLRESARAYSAAVDSRDPVRMHHARAALEAVLAGSVSDNPKDQT